MNNKGPVSPLGKHLAAAMLVVAGLAGPALAEVVYVDVRSVEEHGDDAIAGDLNIPIDRLDPVALAASVGKDADIVVYCQGGFRAAKAKERLDAAGFTHVKNGGGIDDVRKARAKAAAATKPGQ